MRILTRIRGWPTEQYRNKLALAVNILKLLERRDIIDEYIITKGVFVAYPRAVFSPALLVEPYVETFKLETSDPDDAIHIAITKINRAYSQGNLIARHSELRFYLTVSALGGRFAGSLTIRLSGFEKKHYGDVEFDFYKISNGSEHQFSDILLEMFKEDNSLVRKIKYLIIEMFRENPEIKFFTIMDVDYSMHEDFNHMLIAAHNGRLDTALQSHLALLRRQIKKNHGERTRSKFHEAESEILKKMGGIYTFNKLVGELTSRKRLAKITRKLEERYEAVGVQTSKGSFIVIGTTNYLGEAYPHIVKFLYKLLSPFPGEKDYKLWIDKGLEQL